MHPSLRQPQPPSASPSSPPRSRRSVVTHRLFGADSCKSFLRRAPHPRPVTGLRNSHTIVRVPIQLYGG